MNLPLSADLFSKPELPEAVTPPGEDLGKVLLLLLLLRRGIRIATLNLLCQNAHLFCFRRQWDGGLCEGLPFFIQLLLYTFMSGTNFIHL